MPTLTVLFNLENLIKVKPNSEFERIFTSLDLRSKIGNGNDGVNNAKKKNTSNLSAEKIALESYTTLSALIKANKSILMHVSYYMLPKSTWNTLAFVYIINISPIEMRIYCSVS